MYLVTTILRLLDRCLAEEWEGERFQFPSGDQRFRKESEWRLRRTRLDFQFVFSMCDGDVSRETFRLSGRCPPSRRKQPVSPQRSPPIPSRMCNWLSARFSSTVSFYSVIHLWSCCWTFRWENFPLHCYFFFFVYKFLFDFLLNRFIFTRNLYGCWNTIFFVSCVAISLEDLRCCGSVFFFRVLSC